MMLLQEMFKFTVPRRITLNDGEVEVYYPLVKPAIDRLELFLEPLAGSVMCRAQPARKVSQPKADSSGGRRGKRRGKINQDDAEPIDKDVALDDGTRREKVFADDICQMISSTLADLPDRRWDKEVLKAAIYDACRFALEESLDLGRARFTKRSKLRKHLKITIFKAHEELLTRQVESKDIIYNSVSALVCPKTSRSNCLSLSLGVVCTSASCPCP